MSNTGNTLIEGMERLGLIASRIRKNQGSIPQIEIDIILQELRNLYMVALQLEAEKPQDAEASDKVLMAELNEAAAMAKAAEEKRQAEEAAARKAAEEKRQAEEAAARKAAEEKRQAEEAAARKAAEVAARRADEERRIAEAKRVAEAAALKAAAEMAKPVFASEPPQKEATPIMEPIIDKLEGNPNDELFADEPTTPEPPKQPKEVSLFDYFKNDGSESQPTVRTLADKLNQYGRNVEEQLETRVNAKKVDDLRTIININDKFSFMSELFHNNMKAYNDFILRLNGFTDRQEALAHVKEIAELNKWDDNSVVVKSFYKIFDRKF